MINKHELVNENAVFVGTAVEIVEQLRTQGYFERSLPFRQYLRQLVDTIEIAGGPNLYKGIFNESEKISDEELAERFIRELINNGLFKEA